MTTPLERGAKLALDKLLPAATEQAVRGIPEPEQLERLPAKLPKITIPARLLQGVTTIGPAPLARIRLPEALKVTRAPFEAEEVPPIKPPEEVIPPEEVVPTEAEPFEKPTLPTIPPLGEEPTAEIPDTTFKVRDPYTGKDIDLVLKQGMFVWRGDKLEGFFTKRGDFITTRPEETSLWEKTEAFFSNMWRGLPINPYYWKSPQAKWEADRKDALIAWAKEADIENPEEYVEDLLAKESKELAWKAYEPEEGELRIPELPVKPTEREKISVGERFMGEWVIPMLILQGLGLSAIQGRAALAAKPGFAPTVARGILYPIAKVEQATASSLQFILNKPVQLWTKRAIAGEFHKYLVAQGIKVSPKMEKTLLNAFRNIPAPRASALFQQQIRASLVAQYGEQAVGTYFMNGYRLSPDVIRQVITFAQAKGNKNLVNLAQKFLLQVERSGRAEAGVELLHEKFAVDFFKAFEVAGGKITSETGYEIGKIALTEAQRYYPMLYQTGVALEGANTMTHTLVMETVVPSVLQVTPSVITAETIASLIPTGVALTITSGLITQLGDLGYSTEAISAMKPEEAWANLFKVPVTPVEPVKVAPPVTGLTRRIKEVESLLALPGKIPAGLGTKAGLSLELAKLEAETEIAGFRNLEHLETAIGEIEEELGLRAMPYHGGEPNVFPDKTTRQLDEMLKAYEEARPIVILRELEPEVPIVSPVTPIVEPVGDKLTRLIRAAKPARAITERLKTAELAKRVGVYAGMLETKTGREAFRAARAALRGKLPTAGFVPPEEQFSPKEVTQLYEQIKASNQLPLTKGRTADALDKLLIEGKLPTEGELTLLGEVFGPDLIKALLDKRALGRKVWEGAISALNLPKAILASWDLSATLRQGALVVFGQPQLLPGTLWAQIKTAIPFIGEGHTEAIDTAIRSHKYYSLSQEAGLSLPPAVKGKPAFLSQREEAFMTRFAEHIPGVRISERAYVTGLNKLRSDMFYKYAEMWEGRDYPIRTYKQLADLINILSGRGSLGALNRYIPALNTLVFSPRLQMSRVQLPFKWLFYSPPVRKVALRQIIAFIGGILGIIKLVQLAFPEAEVETDPKSTDFMKLKIGDTRLDMWAGTQQYVRLITQLITAQRKTSTGEIVDVERQDLLIRFAETKAAPAAGLVNDLIKGQSFLGEEMTFETENVLEQTYQRLTPLFIQDMLDAIREDGMMGAYSAMPGFLGVGIVSYPPQTFQRWEELVTQKLSKEFLEKNRRELQADFRQAFDSWNEFYATPKGKMREIYRSEHPEIEASLFFWGEVLQITNPQAWGYLDELVKKYNITQDIFPLRAIEEPWEPAGLMLEEKLGNLLDMLPKYLSDYVWENVEEWRTKDLDTLIPQVEKLKTADKILIDRYDRMTAGESTNFKNAYRRDRPEIDVALNFWGRVSTTKSTEAREGLRARASKYGIPHDVFPVLVTREGGLFRRGEKREIKLEEIY